MSTGKKHGAILAAENMAIFSPLSPPDFMRAILDNFCANANELRRQKDAAPDAAPKGSS